MVTKLPFGFRRRLGDLFAMLPIAYLLFYVLNNKESYLARDDEVAAAGILQIILVIALTVSVVGALIKIKTGAIDQVADTAGARQRSGLIERRARPGSSPRLRVRSGEPSEGRPSGREPSAGGEKQ